MSRGRRYDSEPKLNMKKVIAVILVILVLIFFFIAVKKLMTKDDTTNIQTTEYYAVFTDGKWGVIDNKAKTVVEPTYDEMIVVPNHTKDVFICFENTDYEKDSYTTKILNAKNKEIFKQYTEVTAIENHDKNNNLWYAENTLRYKDSHNKYGLLDMNGKVLLEADYDEITALPGTKKAILVKKDGKYGLVDENGKQLIPSEYTKISSLGEDTNLYIVRDENKKYGVYDRLDNKYQEIKALANNEYFCVKENDTYKVINKDEKVVFDKKFDDIKQLSGHVVVYKKGSQYGAYNIDSKQELKCVYDDMKYTSDNNFIVKQDGSYGIINMDGKTKQKISYANIVYYEDSGVYELEKKNNTEGTNIILNNKLQKIAEGVLEEANGNKSYIKLWTENGYTYYNLEGEEKTAPEILLQSTLFLKKEDGKYGYVDKDGNTVVDCIYDDAKEQNSLGYAAIKKDGKWGAVDSAGKVVCEPEVDLEGYLLVDFIGQYHLGRDINLMYYTK